MKKLILIDKKEDFKVFSFIYIFFYFINIFSLNFELLNFFIY